MDLARPSQPFNLASEQRHAAERERIAAETAAMIQVEEQQRVFKARQLDKGLVRRLCGWSGSRACPGDAADAGIV